MAEERLVVVTGATGRQGGAVVRHLLADGWRVRAVTRSPGSAAARELARRGGVEVVQADMEAPEIRALVQKNFTLAQELGIRGTPVFVVGTEVVPGAMDLAALKELVARARAN